MHRFRWILHHVLKDMLDAIAVYGSLTVHEPSRRDPRLSNWVKCHTAWISGSLCRIDSSQRFEFARLNYRQPVMHKHACRPHMEDVIEMNLEVVDCLSAGAGEWNGGGDGTCRIAAAERFTLPQCIGPQELLAIFGPEQVVGRGDDRLIE